MFYPKRLLELNSADFRDLVQSADAFICAAGFEERGELAPMLAEVKRNALIIAYKEGPLRNHRTLRKFTEKFSTVSGYDICQLDFSHLERFESTFEVCLRNLKWVNAGRFVLDISALPNFAICIMIGKIRTIFPTVQLTLLHTEAGEYFPKLKDLPKIERAMSSIPLGIIPEYLSERAATMFFPSMFSGVSLGHNDTCLIIYAGYEPHRTNCVLEALNPSKLVMVYGQPSRHDLKWRLDLSRTMHMGIDDRLLKTSEVASTDQIDDNLEMLFAYYNYLYDDHVICISPINSKMQAVAATLAWETFPDIQLNFPVPSHYLPTRFSSGVGQTFAIDLGVSFLGRRFTGH